jgi:S-adenosylmethionine:tRNA ribosyltransferase-isomerase
MLTQLFDYQLPHEQIAHRPAEPRESARLLVLAAAPHTELHDNHIADFPALLQAGDVRNVIIMQFGVGKSAM